MDKDNKHLFENYLNLNEEKKKNRPVPPPLPGKKPIPPVIPGEEKRRKEEERRRKWRERGKKINTGIEKAVDYVTDKDNLKAAGQGAVNVARGAGKAANYLLNPFNQKGALSDAKNKMETFRDYVAGVKSGDDDITDLARIKGFRDSKVYPRENDINLNQKVIDILSIPGVNVSNEMPTFELKTLSGDGLGQNGSDSRSVIPQIASAFGEYVFKRNRPLRSAAHIANLILDVYVLNLRKEIPPKKAMEIALDEVIKSGALKRWLRDESGLLPADVASVSGSKK